MTASTLPGMLWIPTANYFANREGQGPPRYVILHGTAGGTSAQDLGAYFKSTEGSDNPVSSTYGIGQDGVIAQFVAERDGAYANGVVTAGHDPWWSEAEQPNPNNVTISIEHCKPSTDNSDALTPAQQASSFALVRDICTRNNIPMRPADSQGGIAGHASIDPVNRSRCPGTYPWDALWAYLANGGQDMPLQITDPFAAAHFTAIDGQHWKCKDSGIVVQDAILAYYRFVQGSPRLPRTAELYNVIPGHPECVLQIFEGGGILYQPTNPKGVYDKPGVPGGGQCFLIHLDQDTPALRRLMALAGLSVPAVTQTEIDTAITAIKSGQAALAVAASSLEPIGKS